MINKERIKRHRKKDWVFAGACSKIEKFLIITKKSLNPTSTEILKYR